MLKVFTELSALLQILRSEGPTAAADELMNNSLTNMNFDGFSLNTGVDLSRNSNSHQRRMSGSFQKLNKLHIAAKVIEETETDDEVS